MHSFSLRKIVISTGISYVLSAILLLLVTILVYFGDLSDRAVSIIILAAIALSVFFGAFILARNISGRGLVNGLFVGVLYFFVLMVLSVVLGGKVVFDANNVTKVIVILLSGMLGGILGINTVK